MADGASDILAAERLNDFSLTTQIDFRHVAGVRLAPCNDGASVTIWGAACDKRVSMTFTDPDMARRVAEAFGAAVETEGGA